MSSISEYFEFQLRTKVMSNPGLAREAGAELVKAGWRSAFVVTDQNLLSLGLAGRLLDGIERGGAEVVGVFSDVPANSESGVVERCAGEARRAGADVILAVGGGSVLDTAKCANVLVSMGEVGQPLSDFQGINLIDRPLRPLVAVPTTAGTGSEVTNMAVIREEATSTKMSYISPHLAPDLALLDAELTTELPRSLTVTTGFDALTHAVEAYVSLSSQPYSDGLALKAFGMIAGALPAVLKEPASVELRQQMLVASCLAGSAFSMALVGCVHAMAHAVGGIYGVAHGAANAVLLPFGMEFNMEACPERFADIAWALGAGASPGAAEDGPKALSAIRRLQAETGCPVSLRELGVDEQGLDAVAEAASIDGSVFTNPVPAGAEELLEVLKKAYRG